jgi:hypothetical protein
MAGSGSDPDVKRISRAIRWCFFSGLVLLAFGLAFLIAFVGASTPAAWATPRNIALLVGAFLLAGALLACVRVGVAIDRQQRTITTWWGPLVPVHKTEHLFSQAHFLTVSREERDFGDQTYDVFPVRLEGPGSDAITIHEPRDYDKARHLAEELAKFAGLAMRDRSSGSELAREAGTLDQSLQERLARTGGSRPLPAPPPKARAIFSYGGGAAPTTIEIPPVGRSARWFALTVCASAFVVLFTELAMDQENMRIGMRAVLAFVGLLGFLLPLPFRSAILRERLVVSPQELVFTRRDIFGTKIIRLPASEIEEVEVVEAKRGFYGGYAAIGGGTLRVAIRSDRQSIEAGAALSTPEEIKWLREVLVHVLASRPDAGRA